MKILSLILLVVFFVVTVGGCSSIFTVANNGRVDQVESLVQGGVDPNIRFDIMKDSKYCTKIS